MTSKEMIPRVLQRKEGIQLTYDVQQRIHAVSVYPRQSPNGSTIIVYAHDAGVTVIWYGGRRFRTAPPSTNANHASIDLIDDLEQPEVQFVDEQEEEDTTDPSRPFGDILTSTDIPFNTAATGISFPPLQSDRINTDYPPFFDSHILIAAACRDQTLRIVAIPIQPRPAGTVSFQVVRLATSTAHQDLISDIAITFTAETSEEHEAGISARNRTRGSIADGDRNNSEQYDKWSLLLASVSPTGHGLLLLHSIPVNDQLISSDPEDHIPVLRRSLRSSLMNCRLSFNNSSFPSERHSHLLVTASDGLSLQIYDMLPQTDRAKRQRGSSAPTIATATQTRVVRQTSSAMGRLLITLLPGFTSQNDPDVSPKRKRILDAEWIMQGRAIIVLLEDGEWGIWDIEAVLPSIGKSNNLVKGQTNTTGIQGGAVAKFALRGCISSGTTTTKKSSAEPRSTASSALAPMTPHTRKMRSSGLFRGEGETATPTSSGSRTKGTITLGVQRISSGRNKQSYEESLVIGYGATNFYIPSVQAYWRSETGGQNTFDTLGSGRSIILPNLYANGDVPIAAHLLPDSSNNYSGTPVIPNFMTATSSRLVLLVQSTTSNTSDKTKGLSFSARLTGAKNGNADQLLLNSGQLDVDGMDRILNSMAYGTTNSHETAQSNHNENEDEDIEMTTDTSAAPRSAKSKLVITRNGSTNQRLFT